MRILIVSTNVAKWGGSEELWREVARQALAAGHEVMLSVYGHKLLHERISSLRALGALVHVRPFPSYFVGQPFVWRATAELKMRWGIDHTAFDWQQVKRWQPEGVLISSGETFDHTFDDRSWIVAYCRRNKIRFYLISQFNWEHDMNVDQAFREARSRLHQLSAGHFFVSYRNFRYAEMQVGTHLPKVRIISNPIKLRLDDALPYPQTDRPTLAMIARYQTFIKGQDVMLQALSLDVCRALDFQINLFGEGADEERIKSLIGFYNLTGKVTWRPSVQDVRAIWKDHQLALLPSRAEGTPLTILEAMYCGRSAMATGVGDTGIWVGNSGFVAPGNSVEALAVTFRQALDRYRDWESLGKMARETILRHHNFHQAREIQACLTGACAWEEVGKSPAEFIESMAAHSLQTSTSGTGSDRAS